MKPEKPQNTTHKKQNKKMFYERIFQKYISPFLDFGFKKLFGEECNKDLLLDFLNELLYEEQGRIVSISYLQSERLGIAANSRKAFFDIYCENEKGEKFIVELQNTEQPFFKDRTVYYSTFPIIEQAPKIKNWNFELKAVYVIAILDFVFDEDKNNLEKFRYDVKLSDIKTHKVFYDKLTFIYLEMPKFDKPVEELKTRFEKWMYVLKNLEQLNHLPYELKETIFEKFFAAAEVAQLTQCEYIQYVENLRNYRDNKNCMDFAIEKATAKGLNKGLNKGLKEGEKKGLKEGLKKGREKGLKKGLKNGLKKGLKEGLKEGRIKERENMVLSSTSAGLPIETIATITRLTIKDIETILEKNR